MPIITRRVAAAVTVTTAILLGWAAPSQAAGGSNVGLYGSGDPTYDGVFRQSLAILGLHAAGVAPDASAVAWLLAQQCAGGGFSSYNPNPAKGCPGYDPAKYTGGIDTNATSLALEALLATGHRAQADRAATVLRKAQDRDGGWPFIVGGGSSDPNSTGLVMAALATAGDGVDAGGTAYLAGLQVGCGSGSAPTDQADRGGLATPYSGGAPNVLATVQAVPGLAGLSLVDPVPAAGTWADGGAALPCPAASTSTPTSSSSATPTTSPSTPSSPSAADPSAPSTASSASPSGADVAHWAATWLAAQARSGAVTGTNVGWAILSFAATLTHHDAAESLYAGLPSTITTAGARGSARAAQSTDSPGALGLAALSSAVLGHPGTARTYASRIAATLTGEGASASPSPSSSASEGGSASSSPSTATSAASTTPAATLPRTGAAPGLGVAGLLLVVAGAALLRFGRRRT